MKSINMLCPNESQISKRLTAPFTSDLLIAIKLLVKWCDFNKIIRMNNSNGKPRLLIINRARSNSTSFLVISQSQKAIGYIHSPLLQNLRLRYCDHHIAHLPYPKNRYNDIAITYQENTWKRVLNTIWKVCTIHLLMR